MLDRLDKRQVADLHEKMESRSSLPAPEAVKDLFGRMDEERGSLLPVERAKTPEACPAARETNGLGNHLDDVRSVPYLAQRALRDTTSQGTARPRSSWSEKNPPRGNRQGTTFFPSRLPSAPSRKYLGIAAPLNPLPPRCAAVPYPTVCLSRAPCGRGASTLSVLQAI